MQRIVPLGLRVLQILWTLLLTALIGNLIATDVNALGTSKAAVNFAMFVAVISWLASIYGLLWELWPDLFRPVVALPLDSMSALFSFISAVVLSAKLGVVNCAAIDTESKGGDYIAFGSMNLEKRCREIQGGAVFLWFMFACYCVQVWLTMREARGIGSTVWGGSSIGTSSRWGSTILSSRPMTQVGV